MEVIIRPDPDQAAQLAARLIAARLRDKRELVLGLATGRTMERVYAWLVAMHRDEGLDFSRCRTFNLDEYIGIAAEDPHSYRYYIERHLLLGINIDARNVHTPDGTAADLRAEAARYEHTIREHGGIDLQLLGIGEVGHIGFNEPLSSLMSRTREKALSPATRRQNAPMFGGDPQRVPARALTMGVGTILEARELLLLATGPSKAGIIAKAVEGPVTAMVSASAIQLHPNCKVIVDEQAASLLTQRDYYDWVFRNEPEWREFHTPDAAAGRETKR